MSDLEKELEEFEEGYNETAPPEPDPDQGNSEPEPTPPEPTESQDPAEPTPEPEPEPEPTPGKPEPEPEPLLGEPATVLSETITVPNDPKVYGDLAGKKVTKQELLESGQLEKLITREHHEYKHQQLYMEEKERNRQLEANLQAMTQPAPTQPTPQDGSVPLPSKEQIEQWASQVEATMLPAAKQFAEMGGVEEDLVELYPRFASQYAHQSNQQARMNQMFMDTLRNVVRYVGGKHLEDTRTGSQGQFKQNLGALVSKGELYEPLGNQEGEAEFVTWLTADDNPLPYKDMEFERFTPEVIESAYFDFLRSPAGRKYHPANRSGAAPGGQPSPAAMASGAVGGGRGHAPSGAPPLNDLERLEREYREATESE